MSESPNNEEKQPEVKTLRTTPYVENSSGEDDIVALGARRQTFNISSFRTEINKNDTLPTHSYLVSFSPFRLGSKAAQPLTDFIKNSSDKLILRCENAVLPTVQLLEEENLRRYGYGPVEKIPYGMQFNDLTLTWLVDKRSELIDFFYQWMNTIVLYETKSGTGLKMGSDRPGLDNYLGYEVGYKDDYSCPMVRIRVYDKELNTVTEYIFYDVYPLNIQSQNLAWAQENEVQKLTVTFTFVNMETLTPRALNGTLETILDRTFSAADAIASGAEKDKRTKDFSRPAGVNPQNSVGASLPNSTDNKSTLATPSSNNTPSTTTRNLSGSVIGPPTP